MLFDYLKSIFPQTKVKSLQNCEYMNINISIFTSNNFKYYNKTSFDTRSYCTFCKSLKLHIASLFHQYLVFYHQIFKVFGSNTCGVTKIPRD